MSILRRFIGRAALVLLLTSPILPTRAQEASAGAELLVNPGFDLDANQDDLPDGWSTSPTQVLRREGVAFGGDFEIVSRPGQYVLATQDVTLTPGATYTLAFEAKGSVEGRAGALLLHGPERPEREQGLLWNQRLTTSYATYTRVFTAPNPACRLYLYNVARAGEVAYRRVSLRVGQPDYPVIRALAFHPSLDPVEPPRALPHTAWATPLPAGPLKLLATTEQYRALRDYLELATRCEIDHDLLAVTGEDLTCPTFGRCQQRLDAGEYAAYVVSSRLPEALRRHVGAALQAGAGVVVLEGPGRLDGLAPAAALQSVDAAHPLRRDLPWDLLPAALRPELTAGEVGRGRVVRLRFDRQVTRVNGLLPFALDAADYRTRTWRYWDHWYAGLARCLLWVTRRDTAVDLAVTADAAGLTITVDGAPAGARVELTPRSRREIRFARPDLTFPTVAVTPGQPVPWPAGFPAGEGLADLRLLDGAGRVLHGAALPFDRPRPGGFAGVELAATATLPGGAVAATVASAVDAATRVEAKLVDAWGRVHLALERPLPPRGSVTLPLSLARTLTCGNKLELRLLDAAGAELDSAWRDVYVPELNRRAAWADFHVTSWGDGSVSPALSATFDTMSRELGLTGKFHGQAYLSVESGLVPTYSAGVPGLFPGDPRPDHTRSAGCLSDPAFLERVDARLAERLPTFQDYGIAAWSLGDELELTHRHQVDEVDFAPASLAAYRRWLQERYGSVAALNRQWGTSHASFDAVSGALTADVRSRDNFAPFVDFRTFMTDEWVRVLAYSTQAIRKLDPGARVGHTNTFGALPFNGADFAKICTIPGFDWGQEYSEAIKPQAQKAVFAMWRSFSPENLPNLGWIGYDRRDVAARYEPWWLALHGSRGVSYFATNALDAVTGNSWCLVDPSLAASHYTQVVTETLRDLREGCGKALMESTPAPPVVALLWSHPSLLASWCESRWETPEPPDRPPFDSYGAHFRAALNLRQLLEEVGLTYAYVSPQQIAADPAILRRFAGLFLPATCALDRVTLDHLKAYQQAGGGVVGDVNLLRYDEHGTPWRDASPLAELFGVEAAGPPVWEATTATVDAGFIPQPVTLSGFGRTPLRPAPGQEPLILGRHADGTPAMVVRPSGQGIGIVFNTILSPSDPGALRLFRLFPRRLADPPSVALERLDRADKPTACELLRRTSGPVELLGVIRDFRRVPEDEVKPPALRLRLGRQAHVVDLRAGRKVGTWVDHVDLAPAGGEARLFAALPYEPLELRLTGPERVTAGGDLPVRAEVRASAPPGQHILHVALVGPDGRPRPGYTQNVTAPAGVWEQTLALALNDPPGAWELRVRDVIGGLRATRRFEVVAP